MSKISESNSRLIVTPYAGVWIEILYMRLIILIQLVSLPTRECGLKYGVAGRPTRGILVTPYAGVWIEIQLVSEIKRMGLVTPYAGVWIEIASIFFIPPFHLSLPTRECGLKFICFLHRLSDHVVTPYAGVWIEIVKKGWDKSGHIVTPYAGVWIEICRVCGKNAAQASLPTRECGLKL